MSWFKRTPERPLPVGILKDGATELLKHQGEKNSRDGWELGLRSVLIAKGYEPSDVERAIAYLLQ